MREYDSLATLLKKSRHDTIRCRIMTQMIDLSIDTIWPKLNRELTAFVEKKLQILPPTSPEYKIYRKYYGIALFNSGWYEKDNGDWTKALDYYNKSLKIKEEVADSSTMPILLNNMALIFNESGNSPKAISYYERALVIAERIGDKETISTTLNNIGRVYHNQGNILKALEHYSRCVTMKEQLGDTSGAAYVLNNLAYIYYEQDDIPSALKNYEKAIKIMERYGDTKGIIQMLNNFAVMYSGKGEYDKSLEYLEKAFKLLEKEKNKEAMARCLNNMGVMFTKKEEYDKALSYLMQGLELREKIHDTRGVANSHYSIGAAYMSLAQKSENKELQRKHFNQALSHAVKGLKIARELEAPYLMKPAALNLSKIYKAIGNHKQALEHYKLYIQMRDSLTNEDTRKAGIKAQLKYEFEKQSAQDSVAHAKETEIKNALLAGQKAEIKVKENQQTALYGGLILVIIFAAVMYNRFKIAQKQKIIIEAKEKETQRQNEIITEQKHLVEEKQKEILDSIKYARRIQTALITNEKYITKTIHRLKP